MEKYKIEFKKSVVKDIKSIPKKDVKRIIKKIDSLAEDPRPTSATKLTATDLYRVRQGDYRILYRVEDEVLIVSIIRVRHRKEVYK